MARQPIHVPDTAGPLTEDGQPGVAAAVGASGGSGGGDGPAAFLGRPLSASEMTSARRHTEALKVRALAVLVAPGTHEEHLQALFQLRAAVAGLQDLSVAGAGALMPAGVSAPTRNLAVTDALQALNAAAAAALAHSEDQ